MKYKEAKVGPRKLGTEFAKGERVRICGEDEQPSQKVQEFVKQILKRHDLGKRGEPYFTYGECFLLMSTKLGAKINNQETK